MNTQAEICLKIKNKLRTITRQTNLKKLFNPCKQIEMYINLRSGLRGGARKKLREREKMKRRPDTNRVKPHVLHPNFGCKSDWLFNNKAVGLAFSLVYLTEHTTSGFYSSMSNGENGAR